MIARPRAGPLCGMRVPSLRGLIPLMLSMSLSACGEGDTDEVLDVPDAAAPVVAGDAAPGPVVDAAQGAISEAGVITPRDAAVSSGSDGGEARREAGVSALSEAGAGRDAGDDAGQRADANVADTGRPDAGSADAGSGACSGQGSLRYTLQEKSAPSSAETMAYAKIRMAMDKAVEKYNCYTNLSREVRVSYDPAVATADGNPNGNIRFGSDASMHFVTAMHELGHVFGVGAPQYKPLVQNGVFTGPLATAEMRRVSGDPAATVKSDGTHFWPYGLNYVNEYKGETDLVNHCAIVVAIRKDLGL